MRRIFGTQYNEVAIEGGRILAVTWAIWLHWNEVMFRGRPVSADSVVHEIEGLMASWAQQVS